MAAEAFMRLEQDTKDELELLKNKLSTSYSGAIDRMMGYYNNRNNHLELKSDVTVNLDSIRIELGGISREQLVEFLLLHYQNSPEVKKDTLVWFGKLPKYRTYA